MTKPPPRRPPRDPPHLEPRPLLALHKLRAGPDRHELLAELVRRPCCPLRRRDEDFGRYRRVGGAGEVRGEGVGCEVGGGFIGGLGVLLRGGGGGNGVGGVLLRGGVGGEEGRVEFSCVV